MGPIHFYSAAWAKDGLNTTSEMYVRDHAVNGRLILNMANGYTSTSTNQTTLTGRSTVPKPVVLEAAYWMAMLDIFEKIPAAKNSQTDANRMLQTSVKCEHMVMESESDAEMAEQNTEIEQLPPELQDSQLPVESILFGLRGRMTSTGTAYSFLAKHVSIRTKGMRRLFKSRMLSCKGGRPTLAHFLEYPMRVSETGQTITVTIQKPLKK